MGRPIMDDQGIGPDKILILGDGLADSRRGNFFFTVEYQFDVHLQRLALLVHLIQRGKKHHDRPLVVRRSAGKPRNRGSKSVRSNCCMPTTAHFPSTPFFFSTGLKGSGCDHCDAVTGWPSALFRAGHLYWFDRAECSTGAIEMAVSASASGTVETNPR